MATTVGARRERLTVSPMFFRRIAEVALGLLILIVFSGAAVRLTGSGLGCPDWPQCHGTLTPALSSHVAIEYGNRLLSALVGVPCLLAAVLVWRRRPFRRDLVAPSLVLGAGVLAQGALGAATVLLDLKWQVVIGHYLLSIVLLAGGATLYWRVRRDPAAEPIVNPARVVKATRALVVWAGLIIVLGTFATAAGPHAGGEGTGDVVERMTAVALTTMIKIHGHTATWMAIASIALWVYARRVGATKALRGALTAVCGLLAVQGAIGLAQYHAALPAELVWAHASLAAVLWVAFCFSWMAAGRPTRSPSSDRDALQGS
jgi:cytochrome c oxidase assembly protein subunit 15